MNSNLWNVLKPRLISFAWRALGMLAAAALAFLAQNIGLFNLSAGETAIIGLVIGEATKIANNWANGKYDLAV